MENILPLTHPQDTVLVTVTDSLQISDGVRADTTTADSATNDTIKTLKKYSLSEIEAILERAEQRAKTSDSINTLKSQTYVTPAPPTSPPSPEILLDSNHIIFAFENLAEWPEQNFLKGFYFEKSETENTADDFFLYETTPADMPIKDHPKVVSRETEKSPDWFLAVFIIMLLILARIRLFYGKFISPILVSMVNSQMAQNLFRNKNSLYERANFGFTMVFFLSMSLFFYQLFRYLDLDIAGYSGIRLYLILAGLIFLWYSLRFLITMLVGFVSQTTRLFSEYFHIIGLSVRSTGLILIPVILILAYLRAPYIMVFAYIGIFVIAAGYVLRIVRLFGLFISKRISVLYTILYLCALEILPTLVLYRLVFPIGHEL